MPTKEAKKIYIQPVHVSIVRFVQRYQKEHAYAPTIKEVARALKKSIRHIYNSLDDLQCLGYISRKKYYERSIEIIRDFEQG